ncbi:MAG: (2Fe-2S)-binding protein [Deltaproteobacteria bacterium]|nr:(2Fe-2S)-binding protein [Deltaproteobacteria bacterium]
MAKIFINGQQIEVGRDVSILTAARANGIYIPALCFHPDLPFVQDGSQ